MRFWREERGSSAVFVGITMTTMVACAALAVDVGHLYQVRAHLSATADAAALAGARQLPLDPTGSANAALQLAQENGLSATQVQTSVSSDSTTLTVTLQQSVPMTFARVLGLPSSQVSVAAAAANKPLSSAYGVVPFSVVKQVFQYGQVVILKDNSQSKSGSSPGNFQALSLGGNGANVYQDNIAYGYQGWISVGDMLTTKPGNMAGPTCSGASYRVAQDPQATFDHVAPNSPRILTVPVLDAFDVNGRGQVLVDGFATFFLEAGSGGNGNACSEVTGRFLRWVTEGQANGQGQDFGTASVKLVQ